VSVYQVVVRTSLTATNYLTRSSLTLD